MGSMGRLKKITLALSLSSLFAVYLHAATGTVMPSPLFTATDANGTIISGGKLCTYLAGTTTPATTYFDVDLAAGHANANPVIMNSRGQAVVFLVPGQSYKFTLLSAGTTTDCTTGTTQWTQDNVSAVPPSSSNLDITGTAGTGINAGQSVYLSDGSGGLNSGQWYPTNATNPYSSTTGPVGFATATIAQGASGSIRLAGEMTGLSGLSVGSTYYLSASSAGSVTSTAPTGNVRIVGKADSTNSLVMNGNPNQPPVSLSACNGRLTLTTGVPVTTADVTAATTIFFAPYQGNRCALYDGTFWTTRTFSQLSIAVPNTTTQMYDIWLIDNSGTLGLELLAWTNDTTRATALALQDGVLVKSGDATRRYLGSFRTTGVSGQTEDSLVKRFLFNYYNRVVRNQRRQETTASWVYTTNTYRQANGAAANQVESVIGFSEDWLQVTVAVSASNDTASPDVNVAIGDNSTTAAATGSVQGLATPPGAAAANANVTLAASFLQVPAVGYHNFVWLEKSGAAGNTTWRGTTSSGIFATLKD